MCFSVLLSVYQKESEIYLRLSLDSIFAQTKLPGEVILVKDGPLTHELDSIVNEYEQKYPILKTISLEKNQGLGKALNIGLHACSYDLVARMDTDDIAKPDRFEKQVAVFEKYPDIDVCSAWIDEFKGNISQVVSIRKLPERYEEILAYAQSRCPLNHPVVMFRKSAVLSAGGYLHFPLLEDYYLWVRMLMNGAKFYNIQESLLNFRISTDMFKRRGGWKYAINEFRFQKLLRQIGFIDNKRFVMNVFIRFIARVVPNSWRAFLYKKILRK